VAKSKWFFYEAILPEILGRYFTNTETFSIKNNMEVMQNTDTVKEPYKYCTYKEDKGGKSIMCTQENCPNLCYHYVCLGIKRKPTSNTSVLCNNVDKYQVPFSGQLDPTTCVCKL